MSDSSPVSENETAFGRPAKWSAALPALVVGCGAFLLAVYGTWLLPGRLHPHYAQELSQVQSTYQRLVTTTAPTVSWNLGAGAGDIDVIFSRLIGLERAAPERYWEWGEFLTQHADVVRNKLNNPAASVQPEVQERLLDQASQFEAKAREIYQQLAAGKSTFRAAAVLKLVRREYEQAMASLSVPAVADWTRQLEDVCNGQTELEAAQVARARLLLVQLLIEQAWQGQPGERLVVDASVLQRAERWYRSRESDSVDAELDVAWLAVGDLLSAMIDSQDSPADAANAAPATATEGAKAAPQATAYLAAWESELADLQRAAIEGNWHAVTFAFSKRTTAPSTPLALGLSRTICRLACSPVAKQHPQWAEQCEPGLLLVAQLAPQLPEFSELLWQCASSQSGARESSVRLAPQIPEMLARGQSAVLKHTVSALSASLAGKPEVARTHLELIGRAHANLGLVSGTVLWRAQILANQLEAAQDPANSDQASVAQRELNVLTELMQSATVLEPDSGFHWFVLGTLQFRNQQWVPMRASLLRAQELLGEVPAIEQMLQHSDLPPSS